MVTQVIPQFEIQQTYAQVASAAVPNLLAIIIGPDYVVNSYTINKSAIGIGAYVAGTTFEASWPGLAVGEIVDPASVVVNMDQAAQLYYTDLSSTESVSLNEHQIASPTTIWATGNGYDFSGPPGNVAVGDWVRLSDPTHTVPAIQVSSVVGLIPNVVAATIGSATPVGSPTSTATASSGGTYIGTQNTTYIITVTTAGLINGSAKVSVTTNNAVDVGGPYAVTSGTPISIGTLGVTVTFGSSNTHTLVLGDQWTIAATAATVGAIQTLALADVVTSTLQGIALKVELAEVQNIVVPIEKAGSPPNYNYTVATSTITLAAAMMVPGTDRFPSTVCAIESGTAYVGYRALRTQNANVLLSITDATDVATFLGNVDVPSAGMTYGVNRALSNANGQTVMCIPVQSDDLAGYQAALLALTNKTGFWRFVPLTQDLSIISAVQAAADERSTQTRNLWATTMCGLAPTYINEISSGSATITLDPAAPGTQYTLVTDSSATFVTTGILPGDLFYAGFTTDGWGNVTHVTYQVLVVLSNTQLRLVAGPSSPVAVASIYQIWRNLTPAQTIAAWGTQVQAMSDVRLTSVFPFNPGRLGVQVPNYYLACSLAAIRSWVPPQQGLTNVQVLDWDNMSESTGIYNPYISTILNYGGWCVSQTPAGVVYTVKQLTTDIADTLHAEDNIICNADSCSYYLLALVAPYIGVTSVVPSNLNQIQATLNAGITFLTTYNYTPSVGGQIGPDSSVVFVRPHATLLDTVVCQVDVDFGIPLNNGLLTLVIGATAG
jgi:hypothetical protein